MTKKPPSLPQRHADKRLQLTGHAFSLSLKQAPLVLGFWVLCFGLGFRVQGSGFRVQGSGFRVQGLGFRVCGLIVFLKFFVSTSTVWVPL